MPIVWYDEASSINKDTWDMPKSRPKPPAETRADLSVEVIKLLSQRYPARADLALQHLIDYFTSVDLVGIRDDLKRKP